MNKPGGKCKGCTPSFCRAHYLYVVEDTREDLVKIGLTCHVTQRLAGYRRNGNRHIELRYSRPAGCGYTGPDYEGRAHRQLPEVLRRRGDWFAITVDEAIAAVDKVCARLKRPQ